ncbi:MAG: MFS transporter [Candidatus Sigynarchaeota archaeon]
MPDYMKDYKVISVLGFFRTFSGGIIGTGFAIFILFHFGSYYWSGVSSAAIALPYIFATIICGRVSDKIGRKSSLLIATSSNLAIAVGFMAVVILVRFTTDSWLLALIILLRLAEGIANGFFWPILQASLSDVAMNCCGEDSIDQVEAISRRGQGMYNLGWSLGVLGGQVVLSSMSMVGLLDVVLLVPLASHGINLVIVILFFRVVMNKSGRVNDVVVHADDGHEAHEHQHDGRQNHHVHHVVKTGRVVALFGLVLIFVYGFALGSLSTTTTNLFKAWGIATMIGFTEAIRLATQSFTASKVRLGKKNVTFKIIGTGGLLSAMFLVMASLSMFFAPPLQDLSLVGAAIGIFMAIYACSGLLFGITYAEAMNLVLMSGSTKQRGLLMGMFESSIGAGFFLGPYMAGVLTEFTTFPDSYLVTAMILFSLLAICVVMALYLRRAIHDIK